MRLFTKCRYSTGAPLRTAQKGACPLVCLATVGNVEQQPPAVPKTTERRRRLVGSDCNQGPRCSRCDCSPLAVK
ncbi:hypothetical protein DL89DRAFT_161412 [Linderina pennispora]|uniref:Uncharacterized protein n=1 Tax=Linderina pennispora TaxID=61395 RepID=A0A1Y1W813_9FUNG|nr:uncharacterized protein DL89DRAFT_161412 [Linderina pennispora]ORX69478.1 hypothetical protein DL89DRAFT_161412 [Linderina pennispora]